MLIRCDLCAADTDHSHTIDTVHSRTIDTRLSARLVSGVARLEFVHGTERFECALCRTITLASGPHASRFPFVFDRLEISP